MRQKSWFQVENETLATSFLLFSSRVLAEKYTIYSTERPPFSWPGIIDSKVIIGLQIIEMLNLILNPMFVG